MHNVVFSTRNIDEFISDLANEVVRKIELWNAKPQPSNTSETPQYLDVKATAKFLNLAPQTIYQLVCAGKLKNYKRNKRLYFLNSDLQEFIQQGERKTFAQLAEENSQFLKTKKG